MKKNYTFLLLMFSIGLVSAQQITGLKISKTQNTPSKNDSIPKVISLDKWNNNKTLVLLNNRPTVWESVQAINTEKIDSIRIDKGKFKHNDFVYDNQLTVQTKAEYKPRLMSLSELVVKYVVLPSDSKMIFSLDGEIINVDAKQMLVDEKHILQISPVKLDRSGIAENLYLIKILTRSKPKIRPTGGTIIR